MKEVLNFLLIAAGSFAVALSLELILAPEGLVGGGTITIAIITNHLLDIPVWAILIGCNTAMLIVSARYMDFLFILKTIFANGILTASIFFIQTFEPITTTDVLILIYGGLILGAGIGLIVKAGGALGIEMLAICFAKSFNMKFSTFIFAVNAVTLTVLTFISSLEKSMFSIAILFITSKTIDFILEGGPRQDRSIMIISNKPDTVGKALIDELDLRLTYLYGKGGYSQRNRKIIYCITNRMLYTKVRDIVTEIDPYAIMEASFVYEAMGVNRINSVVSSAAQSKQAL
jgi:uncharacterized membrane-anchored protein YitT (DUF2179 family)